MKSKPQEAAMILNSGEKRKRAPSTSRQPDGKEPVYVTNISPVVIGDEITIEAQMAEQPAKRKRGSAKPRTQKQMTSTSTTDDARDASVEALGDAATRPAGAKQASKPRSSRQKAVTPADATAATQTAAPGSAKKTQMIASTPIVIEDNDEPVESDLMHKISSLIDTMKHETNIAAHAAVFNKLAYDGVISRFEKGILPYVNALEARIEQLQGQVNVTSDGGDEFLNVLPKRPTLKLRLSPLVEPQVPKLMPNDVALRKKLDDEIKDVKDDTKALGNQHKNLTDALVNGAILERALVQRVKGLLPVLTVAAERYGIALPIGLRLPTPDSDKENATTAALVHDEPKADDADAAVEQTINNDTFQQSARFATPLLPEQPQPTRPLRGSSTTSFGETGVIGV